MSKQDSTLRIEIQNLIYLQMPRYWMQQIKTRVLSSNNERKNDEMTEKS